MKTGKNLSTNQFVCFCLQTVLRENKKYFYSGFFLLFFFFLQVPYGCRTFVFFSSSV